MRSEDLFLAIGAVEESRLARSELSVSSPNETEDKNMKVRPTRIIRNLLIAAVIVSMLAVTAYAVTGFLIFENPQEMLTAIFGDKTGFDHSEGNIKPDPWGGPEGILVEPTFDRVPVDEDLAAQEAAPLVEAVGQTISWEGYTLTIDANLYDSVTKCGLVTYTLESEKPLGYSLQSDGEVWFPTGELMEFSQYGRSYIIQDKSSDTKLNATYYYQLRDPNSTDLEIGFTQWAGTTMEEINQTIEDIKQQLRQEIPEEEIYKFQKEYYGSEWTWFETNCTKEEIINAGYEVKAYQQLEELTTCPDKITIPAKTQEEMSNITLGDGAVLLSPVAVTVKRQEIENLNDSDLDLMKINFSDGTEYVVEEGYTQNFVFHVGDAEHTETTYMFNRMIDVKEVTSVTVDGGIELFAD